MKMPYRGVYTYCDLGGIRMSDKTNEDITLTVQLDIAHRAVIDLPYLFWVRAIRDRTIAMVARQELTNIERRMDAIHAPIYQLSSLIDQDVAGQCWDTAPPHRFIG